MISVIIPTCNRPAAFLNKAIESAMVQSFPPHEVIVVDNCTVSIGHESLPGNVTVYRLPQRIGPSRARNFGAARASGTHFAFLDDDDWWDDNFLRNIWSVLHAEKSRCACGRLDTFRTNRIERFKCATPETLTIPLLLRRNPGTTGTNLLIEKKLFWEVGGFDERLRTSEDKALVLEILRADEKISIAPEAVAIMRQHDGVRAHQARRYKLLFSWKYRHLLGYRGLSRELFRLLNPRLLKKMSRKTGRIRRAECA
ncbi:glycosyltransferase family 2 protein [uncultured Parasphingorhabdus sp.]|uniref:glycosyltransferase family 2 protein n=1 Tax=uncultured Parasphingorhabdus sp. TaxID=2709694 RepID=UPI002AA94A79|nr:glycosyltransferase family 2 protein [uncultured Parasphingorhabdus sp.]